MSTESLRPLLIKHARRRKAGKHFGVALLCLLGCAGLARWVQGGMSSLGGTARSWRVMSVSCQTGTETHTASAPQIHTTVDRPARGVATPYNNKVKYIPLFWMQYASESVHNQSIHISDNCNDQVGPKLINSFAANTDVVCGREQEANSMVECMSYPGNYKGLGCITTNMLLDTKQFMGIGPPPGTGGHHPYLPAAKVGSVKLACNMGQDSLFWHNNEARQIPKWFSTAYNRIQADNFQAACTKTVDHPVLFINRLDMSNAYHHTQTAVQVFMTLAALNANNHTFEDMQVAIADHFDAGPFMDIWRRLSFPHPVLPVFTQGAPEVPEQHVRQVLAVPPGHQRLNVLFISRSWFERAMQAGGGLNSWQQQRAIPLDKEHSMLQAMQTAVREWNNRACVPPVFGWWQKPTTKPAPQGCKPTNVSFEFQVAELSLLELHPSQVALFAKTAVMVAAHGAALTNMVFMQPLRGAVVEVFTGSTHYLSLANMLGHTHLKSNGEPADIAEAVVKAMDHVATKY